jgi:NAD(P)-dependent dehydrogenase (short-subunit alcohol dehydrogenase family)
MKRLDNQAAEIRFDGRVAVVTGAGRALGRAHAMLLAARGAKVVVNDFGGGPDGAGGDTSVAQTVVAEIVARGGEAVANTGDVSNQSDAHAMVAAAIDNYGRVDIVINNAGIMTVHDFASLPVEVLWRHLEVHVVGAFNVTQQAWPHFVDQQYGRVVMTISTGVFGVAETVHYSCAKAGVIGLTRSLAVAGKDHGIMVNALSPSAYSRLFSDPGLREFATPPADTAKEGRGEPETVVPVAAFLAHESCPVTGEMFSSTGTNVGRIILAATPGRTQENMTPEAVRDNWDTIYAVKDMAFPASTREAVDLRRKWSL